MMEIKRVLFPVDLSDPSEKIVTVVKNVVGTLQAELHVLYVLHDLDHLAELHIPYSSVQEFQRTVRVGGERKLNEFCERHFSDLTELVIASRIGNPSEEITKYAEEVKADLIIMGTHGRTGVGRIFFGNVADKVVKLSPIPVMTIKPQTD